MAEPFAVRLAIAVAFCVIATLADAAGLQLIEVPADGGGPPVSGAVWYPCAAPTQQVPLRDNLLVPAVRDCPVTGSDLPLVVIAHGRGGWFGSHHDTAEMLADAGLVVAAISYAGDTSRDMSRSDDLTILADRPTRTKQLIDFMLGNWSDRARLDPQRIGIFGFSRGGYTALVAIGGQPDFRLGIALCPPGNTIHMCEQLRRNEIPAAPLPHDPRIKAAVLADPGFSALFTASGLLNVPVPIQLWASEYGGDGVTLERIASFERNLPTRPDYHVVANAGHYAFLAPCSAEQTRASPKFCLDPVVLDRVAFHRTFNAAVLAFFRLHLAVARSR